MKKFWNKTNVIVLYMLAVYNRYQGNNYKIVVQVMIPKATFIVLQPETFKDTA